MSDSFRCELCGRLFLKGWSDEESLAEMKERFGEVPESERVLVCDGCAPKVDAWLEKNPE